MVRKCAAAILAVFLSTSLAVSNPELIAAGSSNRPGHAPAESRPAGFSSDRRDERSPANFGWGWWVAGVAVVGGMAAAGFLFWDMLAPDTKPKESPADPPIDPVNENGSLTVKWK